MQDGKTQVSAWWPGDIQWPLWPCWSLLPFSLHALQPQPMSQGVYCFIWRTLPTHSVLIHTTVRSCVSTPSHGLDITQMLFNDFTAHLSSCFILTLSQLCRCLIPRGNIILSCSTSVPCLKRAWTESTIHILVSWPSPIRLISTRSRALDYLK